MQFSIKGSTETEVYVTANTSTDTEVEMYLAPDRKPNITLNICFSDLMSAVDDIISDYNLLSDEQLNYLSRIGDQIQGVMTMIAGDKT